MIERLATVKARLQHGNGEAHPAETAAEIILKMIGQVERTHEGLLRTISANYGASHSATGHDGAWVRMLRTPFLIWIGNMATGYAHQNFLMILSPGSQECGFLSS